ncbi:MAG: sigma factor-like helix-turn-helix DNA-binding protein [Chloroflexota bacterium]
MKQQERRLFLWWSRLSVRLAKNGTTRLTSRQMGTAMKSLRLDGRWKVPQASAIAFGQRFGFIGPAWTSGRYVFPLAHIIYTVSVLNPGLCGMALAFLEGMSEVDRRDSDLNKSLQEWVDEGLSSFDKRTAHVVLRREGVGSAGRMTLEEIGRLHGITRERVRQIEAEFWKKLQTGQEQVRPFLALLLCDVLRRKGSLVCAADDPETALRRFAARCTGLPQAELPGTRLVILGASKEDIVPLGSTEWASDQIDSGTIAGQLDGRVCLVADDVRTVAEGMAQLALRRMKKARRVYLALQRIGEPAQVSQVAAVYKSMFPNDGSTEHNIHATLCRKKYGIVWAGARRTYALKEWGYEPPSKGFFDAAAEIVQKMFKQTGKPVPFTVIENEMGKYRQIINPTSLTLAASRNPRLRRVSKDSFVPI